MAHVPDLAAGCVGVFKNFHDTRLSTCEELVGPAVFRSADDLAVHSILPLRPSGDSRSVSLFSSLHAASLGWHSAITCNLSRREETRRMPPLVCPLVRAQALPMAKRYKISPVIPRSGNRNTCAVLGRAGNGAFILGPVLDARGFARYIAAHIAGCGRDRRRHELSKAGRKGFRTRHVANQRRTEVFAQKKCSHPSGCAARVWTPPFPALDRHLCGGPPRLSRHRAVPCSRNQGVGARRPLDFWLQPICAADRS